MAWMQIETTRAQLQIQTKRAKLNIQNSMPKMNIRRRNAQMHVERTNPTMTVEKNNAPAPQSSGVHADASGIDQTFRASNSNAGYMQKGDAASRQKAPSVMRSIKNANTASANAGKGAAPSSMRKVRWEPGSMKIDWSPHELEIMWEGSTAPSITVDPYEIEIRLRNNPGVKIRLTDEYYAGLLGRNVDERV